MRAESLFAMTAFSDDPRPLRIEGPVLWCGALSFEKRCVGSLRSLIEADVAVGHATMLDYSTHIDPVAEGEVARARNGAHAEQLLGGSAKIGRVPCEAYSAASLHTALADACDLASRHAMELVVDITCFTKIHTLALAEYLSQCTLPIPVIVSYSLPDNYSSHNESRRDFFGGGQSVIAPLIDGACFGTESRSRGIIMPGHEDRRLLVALIEMEAASGIILRSVTPERPDFERLTERRNRTVLTSFAGGDQWATHRVDFRSFDRVREIVREQCRLAEAEGAPLLLYPFGAKSVILACAMAAAECYPVGTWFVYPVPSFYDSSYTEGIASTHWLRV